jgi:hypothetical protein
MMMPAAHVASHMCMDIRFLRPHPPTLFCAPPPTTHKRAHAHALLPSLQACRFGVVSMCIGSGMGAAAVFERGSEADTLVNAFAGTKRAGLSADARV